MHLFTNALIVILMSILLQYYCCELDESTFTATVGSLTIAFIHLGSSGSREASLGPSWSKFVPQSYVYNGVSHMIASYYISQWVWASVILRNMVKCIQIKYTEKYNNYIRKAFH